MEKSCEYCGTTENLTKDHCVPKWLFNRAHFLGIKRHKMLKRRTGDMSNIQILCKPCNAEKGGMIDYSHPKVRAFMEELREKINEGLK